MKTKLRKAQSGHVLTLALTGSVGILLAASGCGKSSATAGSSTSVSLSGKLGASSGASALYQLRHGLSPVDRISYTGDTVVCATLTTPPLTATASVNSDGSFTIDIAGGANQPMNCNLVDSSGDVLATIVAADDTHTNMNGNPQTADTLAFSVSADLGDISYNPNTGEATVPVSNISQSLVSVSLDASAAFDPTGNWLIGAPDFTLPPGYVGPCASQGNNCNGPPVGQEIYLKRWNGKSIADGSPAYGFQVWQDQGAFTGCGSVMGLSTGQATSFGLDFSENGSAVVPFNFASTVSINGQTKAIANDYQISGATLQYPVTPGCGPQSITVNGNTYSGYVCGPDSQTYYNASLGGGCVDSSGKPVQVNGPWQNTGQCTNTVLGGGYTEWSCPGTYTPSGGSPTAITCTNIGGTFANANLTTPATSVTTNGTFTNGSATVTVASATGLSVGQVIQGGCAPWGNGNSSTTISALSGTTVTMSAAAQCSGTNQVTFGGSFNQDFYAAQLPAGSTTCASLSAYPLLQEQCYGQYYQQNIGNGHSDACLRRVDTDWSTTDPTKFITVGWKPQGLPIMNQLFYLSANSAQLRDEQDGIQGVPSSQQSGNWINCHVHEIDGLSFTAIDSTHILAQYVSQTTTSDQGLPDCVAAYGNSKTKFLFTLTKQ